MYTRKVSNQIVLPESDVVATDLLYNVYNEKNIVWFGSVNRNIYKLNYLSGEILYHKKLEYGLSNIFV